MSSTSAALLSARAESVGASGSDDVPRPETPARPVVAPANPYAASASPSSRSTSVPSASLARCRNSAPFAASRAALVATARTAVAWRSSMIWRYSRSTSTTRPMASSRSRPPASTPRPSPVMRSSRCPSGVPSSMSRRVEFVPQSTTATGAGAGSTAIRARHGYRLSGCRYGRSTVDGR